ncbi:MAG: PIN domain-containing protein [candidate division KSB1 bacterium]|nr:PIN domain-containing protein [candidate division KSB1 bacterium]MDZ7303831.1 PIN domain-containing protein [candidate division KSB1 bacterium]MDZ7312732.1 PIN domain-containing protein [candidate division KSB1 bacterium]
MKAPTFIDTGHILALVFKDDEYHDVAKSAATSVTNALTTEAVLAEIGNALSQIAWRQVAVDTIKDLRSDPDVEILSVDTSLFDRAFQLYSSRPDKEWSLTDCISFVVMQERGMTEALTTDHHFQQAGFRAVLRELKSSVSR